jgi:hypothetical protein
VKSPVPLAVTVCIGVVLVQSGGSADAGNDVQLMVDAAGILLRFAFTERNAAVQPPRGSAVTSGLPWPER